MSGDEVKVQILPNKEEGKERLNHTLHLQFKNLHVKVDDKQILRDISGEVKPGEMLAIMGPSGAGKSTLLNFLSGRDHGMQLESGEILLNGQTATKRLRRGIGHVLQEDVFFSHLTVNQTLEFVGEVRLSDSHTSKEKKDIVDGVIDELGLRKTADTVLGDGMFVMGISGGEKKRCSIAVELITNPALLILDEPTSGLDSSTACSLIQTVQKLATEKKRAVIMTIHQPSSHVFHMFDKLLLLCNGRIAYYGKTAGVIKFFETIGMPCYPNWNPADFIMDQLTAGKEIEEKIIEGFPEFQSNPDFKEYMYEDSSEETNGIHPKTNGHAEDAVDAVMAGGSVQLKALNSASQDPSTTEVELPRWPTGYYTQAKALAKRAFIQSKSELWDKQAFIQTFFVSIITGLLWFNTPFDEKSLQDRQGVIFYAMLYLIMDPMFHGLMAFPSERNTIGKERAAGMYRLSAYFTAKCLSELPVLLFQPIVFYSIVYWMAGLNRSPMFLVALLLVLSITLLAQTFGLVIGAIFKNFKLSITFAVIFSNTVMLLAGFYTKRVPFWLNWAKYVSHLTYAYNVLVRVEFGHAEETFKCAVNSAFAICGKNGTTEIPGSLILPNLKTIDLGIGESFAVIWLYILITRIVLYYSLRFMNKPQ